MLPLSFDGRVAATKALSKDNAGAFQATVKVVRKIKGDVASEVSVFTNIMGSMCGVAEQLEFARARGRILEFGVQPNKFVENVPADELLVSLCSLSSSELEPTLRNTRGEPYLLR